MSPPRCADASRERGVGETVKQSNSHAKYCTPSRISQLLSVAPRDAHGEIIPRRALICAVLREESVVKTTFRNLPLRDEDGWAPHCSEPNPYRSEPNWRPMRGARLSNLCILLEREANFAHLDLDLLRECLQVVAGEYK